MKTLKYTYSKTLRMACLLTILYCFNGCKKFVEVDVPTTSLNSENIYSKDITAISVLNGIYTKMSNAGLQEGNLTSMSYLAGLSADEFKLYGASSGNPNVNSYYINDLNTRTGGPEFWTNIYNTLYINNAAFEGVSASNTLSPVVKQQLIGECRFIRALCFFYLVNLYGDVPLTLSTDYKANSVMLRTPKAEVWKQIITDLLEAENQLSEDYLDGTLLSSTSERVRPTKWAAKALLARVYLYQHDWQQAEELASEVLGNSAFKLPDDINAVFKRNSTEAIWQLQPVLKGFNAPEGNLFIVEYETDLMDHPTLSNQLLGSFEPGDQRRRFWINSIAFNGTTYYYPYKYKVANRFGDPDIAVEEYGTVLRLAEQYLIRAEAKIRQNKIESGIEDLNVLRARATDKEPGSIQLEKLSGTLSMQDALDAVLHERQVELFSEWGHRWLDLKRIGKVDEVMATAVVEKSGNNSWKSYQQLYPLPIADLQRNRNLVQNDGY